MIQRSYPYYIVSELFSSVDIQLCIFTAKAQRLLVDIERIAIKYSPTVIINIINDIDDNKFLELAETSNASFLITGNTNDFTMKEYMGTKIVTPKEFWETYCMR